MSPRWRSTWPALPWARARHDNHPGHDGHRCGADHDGQDPLTQADLRAGQTEGAAAADHAPLDVQRDVAPEEKERAVGHVDGAHEPEDEGEPAGHDEVERRCGEPVEQRDEEVLGIVHGGAEAGPVGDEQHPDDQEGDHEDEQGSSRQRERAMRTDALNRSQTYVSHALLVISIPGAKARFPLFERSLGQTISRVNFLALSIGKSTS